MEIIYLPVGQRAADDVDCVHIEQLEAGRFTIECSALQSCGDGDEVESVAVVDTQSYDTAEAAEAAGLAWADAQCVATLYVSRSTPMSPEHQ